MKTYRETIIYLAENIQSNHTTGSGIRSDANSIRLMSYIYDVDEQRIRIDVNEVCNKLFGLRRE